MTTDDDNGQRPYRCANRSCGREITSAAIPKNWLGLRQYAGDYEIRPSNLGVYCSFACLAEAVEGMQERADRVTA